MKAPLLKLPITWIVFGIILVVSGIHALLRPESHRKGYNRWLFPISFSQQWKDDPRSIPAMRRNAYINVIGGALLILVMLLIVAVKGIRLTESIH